MTQTIVTLVITHNGQSQRVEMEVEPELFDGDASEFVERIIKPMVFAVRSELVKEN